MAKFEKMRSDALLEKNKSASRAYEFSEKSENLKEKSDKIKEGIARIPKDLPEDLQQQVDAACEKVQSDVKSEAKALANEVHEAQANADKTFEKIRQDGQDLQRKGEKMGSFREVPLLGAFADAKSRELKDDGEQLIDIAKETQGYSDKLAEAKNRLMGI